MRVTVLLAFAILTFAGSADAIAQCRVQGVVLGPDGTPIAGATVRLDGPEYKVPLVVTAGADGAYVFESVRAGTRVRLVALLGERRIAVAYALVTLGVEEVELRQPPAVITPTTTSDVLATDGPSGSVAGVVRDAGGEVVPGARIAIAKTTWAVHADAAGRYGFSGLRPGVHLQLVASAPRFQPASQAVVVPDGSRIASDFSLQPSAGADPPPSGESGTDAAGATGRLTGDADTIWNVPGLARSDVRDIALRPDVLATLEAIEDFHVRGGAPGETLVTADGYTLYPFSHTFGRLSPFSAAAVESAELSSDTSGSVNGGRLAGLLRLQPLRLRPGAASGYAEASLFGVSGSVGVPIGQRGSLFVAARRSPPSSLYGETLDLFSGGAGTSARDRVGRYSGGTFAVTPDSSFRDLNIRADLAMTKRDRLTIGFYDARDDVNNAHDLQPPAFPTELTEAGAFSLPSDAVVEVSDGATWRARAAGATWARSWSRVLSTTVSFGRSEYATGRNRSWLLTSPSTGLDYSLASGRGGSRATSDTNDLTDTTFRMAAMVRPGFAHVVSLGGELSSIDAAASHDEELFATTAGTLASSRLVRLFDRADTGRLATVFAQDLWRPLIRLTIAPGVRITHYDLAGATYVEPRLRGEYQVTPFLRAVAGWSIDHQFANRIAREDRVHGDTSFWALADGTSIPVARAQQFSGGGIIEMNGVVFDVQGYYKLFDDLTVFAPRLFPGVAPLPGTSFLHVGTGTARGLNALTRVTSGGNTFSAGYALGQVTYTYPTLEAAAFPAAHDQRHELKVADTIRFGRGWAVGGAMVVGSGRPYTAAESVGPVWFPTGTTVYDITFGSKNGARLPAYQRVDLSAQRDFHTARIFSTLGVTVFNVLNRGNVGYKDYEAAGDRLVIHDVLLLGRAVNVLLRIGF